MTDSPHGAPDELITPSETDTPFVRLSSGSALSLAAQVLGLATSFIVGVVAARTLGVAGKGMLSVVMQTAGILVMLLDLGIATSTIYFVAHGELKPGAAAANSFLIAAAMAVLSAPALYLLLASRFAVVHGVPKLAVAIAILVVPTSLLLAWTSGISVGLSDLRLPLRSGVASSATTLLAIVGLAATGHANVGTIAAASVAGTVAGIVVIVWGLRNRLAPLRPDWVAARATSSFSVRVHMTNLAGFMLEKQDVLLLGWLAGAAAVGLYSVGVSFAELNWYIPSALSTAIMARASYGTESTGVDYVTRGTRVLVIIMGGTVGVSLIVVPLVIPLIYGHAFAPSMYAFFALLPGIVADGVARVLWTYQTIRERLYWRQALGGTAVNMVLVLLMVPRFGPVGAALASTLAYGGMAVYVIHRFRTDTGATYADVLLPRREDLDLIFATARRMLGEARGHAKA